MRHSTIVLTMDTYGHLFPGQDAATVARLPNMMASEPVALRATGTDGPAAIRLPMKTGGFDPGSAQKSARMRSSQGAIWRRTMRRGATKKGRPQETAQAPTLYELRTLCESVRDSAKRRARDSNPQPVARHLISSLDKDPKNPEKSRVSPTSAAQGAALSPETPPADPQLASAIDTWPALPSSIRDTIVAIIQATGSRNA